jgi:hypothetical protein
LARSGTHERAHVWQHLLELPMSLMACGQKIKTAEKMRGYPIPA